MLTKLTLTVDQDIVRQAKKYAKERHRSVSRLVEEYLRTIAALESQESGTVPEAPITASITGMFSAGYKGEADRELLEAALLEGMK
ncbi:MAG: DUF6364 family protein [Spirochaetota bacterium]